MSTYQQQLAKCKDTTDVYSNIWRTCVWTLTDYEELFRDLDRGYIIQDPEDFYFIINPDWEEEEEETPKQLEDSDDERDLCGCKDCTVFEDKPIPKCLNHKTCGNDADYKTMNGKIDGNKSENWGELAYGNNHLYNWNLCGICFKEECGEDDEEEEEAPSTFVVRLERPMYDNDDKLISMMTIEATEYDTIDEALEEFENYSIEPVGELLYLDEKNDEDDYWENIESRGKLVHEDTT